MRDDQHRLPRHVVPRRYDIVLEPDLAKASFVGEVQIAAEALEVSDAVVLNAIELEIDEATVGDQQAIVAYDTATERATLTPPEPIEPGPLTIVCRFRGVLNDQLHGFYRSTYTDDDGEEHVIATTQFESTNARRAFPCFDEPDLKAVFGVTLVVADDLTAVSCGEEIAETPTDDGRRRVQFADTMLMSTYLVAFIVGQLEITDPVDVDGVPLRVVHVPGKAHLTDFALRTGEFALRFLSEYYDIGYPGGKVDLVAVPDFAFGAMENLGCVTFRETLLLADPETATVSELTRIADVINHELAHMWFGDLVTMKWWNGIWLKEAFATFMEITTADAFEPAWKRWEQFGQERSSAFDTDALASTRAIEFPVKSPADAEAMYDVLTYEKGAAVVRMLEQYLTPERFRDGIRHYLSKYSYANTETTDLWDALEEATGEPVRQIADSWIFQGGHPIIDVSLEGSALVLQQRQFRYLDAEEATGVWTVPIIVRAMVDGAVIEDRILLASDTTSIDLAAAPEWAVANAGAHGFYRVSYSAELLARLVGEAQEVLSPTERFALVDDAWAAVLAGTLDASAFVALAQGFALEADLGVWRAITGGLGQLARVLDGDPLAELRSVTAALTTGALDIIGFEPATDESPLTGELRGLLFRAAGAVGNDLDIRARAGVLHEQYLDDSGAVDPELATAAAAVVATHGNEDDYDLFATRHRKASTPQEEVRYLYLLADFPDLELMDRTLEMSITDVRTQNAPFLLATAMRNREHGPHAWRFVRENWELLNERFPSNSIVRMLSTIPQLSRPEVAADVESFFAEHDVPQGPLTLQQHLEKLRVHVRLRELAMARH